MPPVGFEPTISAGEWPKTYALDRAATGTGFWKNIMHYIITGECNFMKHKTINRAQQRTELSWADSHLCSSKRMGKAHSTANLSNSNSTTDIYTTVLKWVMMELLRPQMSGLTKFRILLYRQRYGYTCFYPKQHVEERASFTFWSPYRNAISLWRPPRQQDLWATRAAHTRCPYLPDV